MEKSTTDGPDEPCFIKNSNFFPVWLSITVTDFFFSFLSVFFFFEERTKLVIMTFCSFNLKDASSDVGFFHSGSSYDYNNDGHKDVILVNSSVNEKVNFYKNQGDGTFVNDNLSSREPTSVSGKSIYTIEMFDINGCLLYTSDAADE